LSRREILTDIHTQREREREREREFLEGSFVHTWNVEKWIQVIEEDLKLDCKDAGRCEIMGMYMSMTLKHISRCVGKWERKNFEEVL